MLLIKVPIQAQKTCFVASPLKHLLCPPTKAAAKHTGGWSKCFIHVVVAEKQRN